jgi:hypothetical protein
MASMASPAPRRSYDGEGVINNVNLLLTDDGRFEKEGRNTNSDGEAGAISTTKAECGSDYLTGVQLLMVVAAMVLSIFLVALDMVSSHPVQSTLVFEGKPELTIARPLSQQLYPRLRTSSTV